VPLIVSLREKVEGIRARETERTGALLGGLTREQREAVDYLTRAIVNKILHGPTTRLKDRAVVRRDTRFVEAVRQLFDLDDNDRFEDADE
jgi:glutamyl-tRNA reductase